MSWNVLFFLNSILLGVGLAMDAFSVSLANGLHEPRMGAGRMCAIAGVYAGFQFLMPLLGCLLGSTVSHYIMRFGPYISFALLAFINLYRLIKGPTAADRMVAGDAADTLICCAMILFSLFSGRGIYLDIAIIGAMLGIIDTLLVGRYLEGRGWNDGAADRH